MAGALRVTRPAGLLAARFARAAPWALGSARLWQRGGNIQQIAAWPTTYLASQSRRGGLGLTVRCTHTTTEPSDSTPEPPSGSTAEPPSGSASEPPRATRYPKPRSGSAAKPPRATKYPRRAPRQKRHQLSEPIRTATKTGVVTRTGGTLSFVRFSDGNLPIKPTISLLWLRDACPCSFCVDPDSGQKTFSTTDVPNTPWVQHAELTDDGSLKVVWERDFLSGGQSHTSVYPAEELTAWQTDEYWIRHGNLALLPRSMPWDRAAYEALLAEGRCRVSYQDWMNQDDAFWKAFGDLRATGLIFITDVPQDEKEVERIASRIGPLQHTFYGWTWDVRSKPQAENVAYTNKFLGLHQDLLYHDPVPQLQLLHCLANDCEGGESLFSHGTHAAYQLMSRNPRVFKDLSSLKTAFGYKNGEHHYVASRCTISINPSGLPTGTRWAPPFQATFPMPSNDRQIVNLRRWKQSAKRFRKVIEAPENVFEVKLKPGECVIFNNWEVLHGRRQFDTAEGSRWLKGAYISPQTYKAAVHRFTEHLDRSGQLRAKKAEQEPAEAVPATPSESAESPASPAA
ncbi:0d8140cd-6ee7-4f64-ba6a-436e89832011 [Thermothielavioides terrestris]|uniref:TauD/TfdA-like domain-containing protein n=2 Tax=Thermothielavioides terrestris TaxID=2587410 RepID=G2R6B1_THETT|nr:uncharacterized protein THITE_2117990 [Thermothielavioides terrestris NRRL 8126]AEO68444.1 hypothetical protein THITE_2117990 [Thermothielavioides terrestris NRRL 8126]SPQ24281.1 0d8140cd-6ee7-4f64-ba6a-436e89832011 [Thermothielavioides terrestris]